MKKVLQKTRQCLIRIMLVCRFRDVAPAPRLNRPLTLVEEKGAIQLLSRSPRLHLQFLNSHLRNNPKKWRKTPPKRFIYTQCSQIIYLLCSPRDWCICLCSVKGRRWWLVKKLVLEGEKWGSLTRWQKQIGKSQWLNLKGLLWYCSWLCL